MTSPSPQDLRRVGHVIRDLADLLDGWDDLSRLDPADAAAVTAARVALGDAGRDLIDAANTLTDTMRAQRAERTLP